MKRNVLDIYKFACRTYQPGDRIFGFGFSRGAFTMRVAAGLIAREGLVKYDGNEAALARYAVDAYRAYRRRFNITRGLVGPLREARDGITRGWRGLRGNPKQNPRRRTEVDKIHFLGLWDTVDAYGGPIEEIILAIDYWFWPLSMRDRLLYRKINRACHALALEDERDAFRPVIWDERYVLLDDDRLQPIHQEWSPPADKGPLPAIDRERLSQVWFVGVHSDIGGGIRRTGCPTSRSTGCSTEPSSPTCSLATGSARGSRRSAIASTSSMTRATACGATTATSPGSSPISTKRRCTSCRSRRTWGVSSASSRATPRRRPIACPWV